MCEVPLYPFERTPSRSFSKPNLHPKSYRGTSLVRNVHLPRTTIGPTVGSERGAVSDERGTYTLIP